MALELRAVSVRHPSASRGLATSQPPALQPLDLRLAGGEHVAVIGPSGAGKTTLLQLLACAQRPLAGEFLIDGQAPWQLPRRALQKLRGQLFLAPQMPPLPPRQRVVTAVLAGALPGMGLWASLRSWVLPVDLAAAQAALQRFGLADKLFDRVDRLSGGERQRIGLARALVAPARLWLIDEPLSALDPSSARQALAALVDAARERGATLVASLHQVDAALAQFPRIVGLREGRLAFDLPAAQVTPAQLEQLYLQSESASANAPASRDTEANAAAPSARLPALPWR
jgi:phosphonate transport system ATP-binding protein